jgi:mannose-1-phosphate guanylyltransferase
MAETENRYGLIMAGGRGTRFWPRSRRARAKQVLDFFGSHSLIQETVERLAPVLPPERLWVITSKELREEIVAQLPQVPERQILAEPCARNTAPCIGLAARILASLDPDAVMGVFPADHVITETGRYRALLEEAFRAADAGRLVVLGIRPRWPETGYGYIEFATAAEGVIPVRKFHEKPGLEKAKAYVAAGNYFWNAGMFFWRAADFLEELHLWLPGTARLLEALPPFGDRAFPAALEELFPGCDNVSVDYAVMEQSQRVAGLVAEDIGWNDVGSWNAVYDMLVSAGGEGHKTEVLTFESQRNYVEAPGKLTALVGVEDLIVVDTPDALLICHRDRAQQVGEVVKLLEQQKRDHLL